jgi:hypothetical protein
LRSLNRVKAFSILVQSEAESASTPIAVEFT